MENGYSNYWLNKELVRFVGKVGGGNASILEFSGAYGTYGISGNLMLGVIRHGIVKRLGYLHPLEIPGINFEYYASDGYVVVNYNLPFAVWTLKDGVWR